MRSLLQQILVITKINVKSIGHRPWTSLSTVFAIALVVMVLLGFLAMGNGFRHTLEGTGSEDVALVLRGGAQSELNSVIMGDQARLIEQAPGVAHDSEGKPLTSPELYVTIVGVKQSTGLKANLPLRGMGPQGAAIRKDVHIVAGRMFARGTNEVVVGMGISREFRDVALGSTIGSGAAKWKVVGLFEAGGTAFESEIWGDLPVVQAVFRRPNVVQTVRVRLENASALEELKTYLANEPRLKLEAKSEKAFFTDQASRTSDLIQKLGWPLALAMALGALAGALNTMYSSVAARAVEIATLRAIGFGGTSAFVGTLIESLLLALLGGLVGALCSLLALDGLTTSTIGASLNQVVFSFKLTPGLAAQGVGLALFVGLIGGTLPALRAARSPIVRALNA